MFNLRMLLTSTKYLSVLSELVNLQHLDISGEKVAESSISTALPDFLKSPSCLPQLISLDISGNCVDIDSVKEFLKYHPQMKFLGLLEVKSQETKACEDDIFCKSIEPYQKLIVTGHATEKQILESLRRYMHRASSFIQKCLCYLYSHIQSISEVRLDIIKLVLQSMKTKPHLLGVQMAATACLYNLTKGGLSSKIHTKWLKEAVDLTLLSMENFPKQRQLQENALLTLCSDRMLQDVSFNRYRCAELVMDSLLVFEDPAMNRMSVAICSILAARITTAETSVLGAKQSYMKRLLSIVKTKTEEREVDIMMKFTLSALWNLSDESPRTCKVFLNQGGMDLFLEVLHRFPGESPIETKVLGLLNNIAEVNYLRQHFMDDVILSTVKSLLHSEHIDVSYFAAGIVAHVASDGEDFWSCDCISWKEIVEELGHVVNNWEVPEIEMVAYRSFNPFYPLFDCYKAYQVQLWAAWAMHHVCSKNPKRYCHMIIDEGGVQILQDLQENPHVHSSVRKICKDILLLVEGEHPNSFCAQTFL